MRGDVIMQVWLLDSDNFWTGRFDFVEEVTEGMTDIPLINEFVRSQLVNGEWVEGATEEEIQSWKDGQQIDNCSEPTTEERVLKLEEEKSILAENVYQLASILEIMLGGTESGQTETTTTDTAN